MRVYLDLVMVLNFAVDFLLFLGTNRLSGYSLGVVRAALAACLGAVYAGLCMLETFAFLAKVFWRIIFLCLMSLIAFGCNPGTLRRGILFVFLSTALGGIALGIGSGSIPELLIAAGSVAVMCVIGFSEKVGSCSYIPVELKRNERSIRMTALRDTGNTLKDPITGQAVLITGPEIAWELLGLTQEQLLDPIGTFENRCIPGLRLIPYRSVGKAGGMLLAVRFDEVKIGGVKSDPLVAFSPNGFGRGAEYQALTGGI